MNFFQNIFELTDGIDVTISIKRKNGKLTLSVLPQTTATIQPAIITGTPEELDAGFFDAVKAPIETAKGLKLSLDNFKKSVDMAHKETTEPAKKEAPKAKLEKPEKPESPKDEKAKVDKPKIQEPKLFGEND